MVSFSSITNIVAKAYSVSEFTVNKSVAIGMSV